MTYCFAWKSNNEIYIVADSLTSTKIQEPEIESDYSSMGERYGEYNSYFVTETDTKIYREGKYVIAFAGDLKTYEEIKYYLKILEQVAENEIVNYLKEILGDAEIILAIMEKDNNQLFLLNKREIKIINNFVSIGSGKTIADLDNVMKGFSQSFPCFNNENIDDIPRKRLSAATAYLQLILFKNNFLEYGVGGTVCGICIYDNKIEWNDDLLYFFHDEKFKNKKLINMLIRNDTILTGSDFTGLTKLFRLPETGFKFDEVLIRKITRSMNKNMSSHIPRYIVFYSIELNNVYFYDTKRKTQTTLVKMFQRRSNISVKWDVFVTPYLISNFLLKYNYGKDFAPKFNYLEGLSTEYVSRNHLIGSTENIEDVDFEHDCFDYPLETIKIEGEIEGYLKRDLEYYENFIIINSSYLVNKILELRKFYEGLNVQFDSSKILKNLCDFLKEEWCLDKISILLFSKNHQFFFEKIDDLELIIIKNSKEFYLFSNKLLHNYYTNQQYFHLNKVFIIDDSSGFNTLFKHLPDYNKNREEADIFMIKNQNGESKVRYEPYYYNADLIFSKLSGLSQEVLGLWSPSEYSKKELERIREYLNKQLDDGRT